MMMSENEAKEIITIMKEEEQPDVRNRLIWKFTNAFPEWRELSNETKIQPQRECELCHISKPINYFRRHGLGHSTVCSLCEKELKEKT